MINFIGKTKSAYRLFSATLALLLLATLTCTMKGSVYLVHAADEPAATDENGEEVSDYQTGDTVHVKRGSFVITRSQSPDYYQPVQENLFIKHERTTLASINVRNGDRVEAGTVLMTFTREDDLAASESRRIELERARKNVASQEEQSVSQLADLRRALAAESDSYAATQLRLDIQIAEENLRWQRIQNQQWIDHLVEADEEAAAAMAETELLAPFAGEIRDITSRRVGDRLNNWEFMCRIIATEPFLLQLSNSYGEYRLGDTVTIEYGPAKERETLEAEVVSDFRLLGTELAADRAYLSLKDVSPSDALRAIKPIVITEQERVDNVLLLPRKAVQKQNQEFYVNLKTDTGLVRRYVQIGNWNTDVYWILDGLDEGDAVVIE